ncbi:MAG: hypothetical protein R3A45_06855 [Bdellovibrionota bacterium]
MSDYWQSKIKEKSIYFYPGMQTTPYEAMDHALFCGPPGLKTTLANIIAERVVVNLRSTSARSLKKRGLGCNLNFAGTI